jgi:hypothetical protein
MVVTIDYLVRPSFALTVHLETTKLMSHKEHTLRALNKCELDQVPRKGLLSTGTRGFEALEQLDLAEVNRKLDDQIRARLETVKQ